MFAAVLALAAAAGPARGAVRADSVSSARAAAAAPRADSAAAAHPDTIAIVGGRTSRAAPAAPDSGRVPFLRQPRSVMLRSLVFPGWGQLYNHAWLKAVVLGGGEIALGVLIAADERRLGDLQAAVDAASRDSSEVAYEQAVNEYNARLDQRVAKQWLLAGVVTYALVDAYVDAHFHGFDMEFRHDPALPEGVPPPKGGAAPPAGARLSLRWHF